MTDDNDWIPRTVHEAALQAAAKEHERQLQAAATTHATEMRARLWQRAALVGELERTRLLCVNLQKQVQQLSDRLVLRRVADRAAARVQIRQAGAAHEAATAQIADLEAALETERRGRRMTMTQLQESQEAEQALLAKKQETTKKAQAASVLQAVERGRRTRAEAERTAAVAERTAAEQKQLRAEERLVSAQKNAAAAVAAAKASTSLESAMASRPRHGVGAAGADEMTIFGMDGRERPMRQGLLLVLQRIERSRGGFARDRDLGKFAGDGTATLTVGRPEEAALGLAAFLKVDEFDLFERLTGGVDAISDEVLKNGTDIDRECLHYVLHEEAGSSSREFANGLRDRSRRDGHLCFADFVEHPHSKRANLKPAHVLALRLYTTAAFRSINSPLRDQRRTAAHPFAATVFFLTDGIRRLRAIAADAEKAERDEQVAAREEGGSRLKSMMGVNLSTQDLWRGMSNMGTAAEFEASGGSEMAPMSTTADPAVAIAYGQSSNALLFKIKASSFMNRGADISFLSAFPEESEFLYPPLTFIRPTGRKEVISFAESEISPGSPAQTLTVLEVEGQM